MEKEKTIKIDEIYVEASENLKEVESSERPEDEESFIEEHTIGQITLDLDDKD